MPGGWIPVKQVTLEENKLFLEVRPAIENMAKTKFKIYFPVVCSSQVVDGVNYMVKVLVDVEGNGVCVDALIFQALPCHGGELSVTEIQYPISLYDPLKPFEHKK